MTLGLSLVKWEMKDIISLQSLFMKTSSLYIVGGFATDGKASSSVEFLE